MQTRDLYLRYWPYVREGLFQALDQLTDEQLDFTPREGLWSLGEIACHIAEAEEGWFRHVVTGELGDWPKYRLEDYASVAAVKTLLDEVHGRTVAYLESLDEAGLDQVIEASWGGKFSLRWIFWHVLEHEVHHRGEIFLLLGLLGMEAPDV
jgi:uncharacterized damage-inducible protein DinB